MSIYLGLLQPRENYYSIIKPIIGFKQGCNLDTDGQQKTF